MGGITKHGDARRDAMTLTYSTWKSMNQRCNNRRAHEYPAYGGCGITICDQWSGPTGFATFLRDMGERPSLKHSLDRIDGRGNYEPANCRWATADVQQRNTRRNHMLTLNGETLCLTDWAKRLGLSKGALRGRLTSGWPIERALTEGPCAK